MKRFYTILFLLCFAVITSYANGIKIGDFYYLLDSDTKTAKVTYERWQDMHNYESLSAVELPADVMYNGDNYRVVSIDTCAFAWAQVSSFVIPAGVTSIEERAFEGCTKLVSLKVPATISFIAENSFVHCMNLTKVTVPENVQIHRIPKLSEIIVPTNTDNPYKPEKEPVAPVISYDELQHTFTLPAQPSFMFDGAIVVDLLRQAVLYYR